MKQKTLKSAVTNILLKRVTEDEAKDFALNNYGVLCAYIRNEYTDNLMQRRKSTK